MTYPPPPPDRTHLQYQPAPVPQQPQHAGPGGAYGPAPYAPGQPVPGQLPVSLSTPKPGTITGIRVILWILLALSGAGDVFAVIGLVEFFSPVQLLVLAYTVYTTVQALLSGVHITRGRRWAWIWSLVSAIIGLVMSAAAIVFGIVYIEAAAVTLLIGVVLGGLYGTLLGLLCSKSARQWILMHRVQRGEVPLPGTAGPAGTAQAGAAGLGAPAPQRPETRPVSAAVTAALLALLAALSAWAAGYGATVAYQASSGTLPFDSPAAFHGGTRIPLLVAVSAFAVLVCALISAAGVYRGRFGARVFTVVWTAVLAIPCGLLATGQLLDFARYGADVPPPMRSAWMVPVVRDAAIAVLVVAAFIAVLLPGVRAWTPGRGPAALVVVVPAGGQAGPYGPAPQDGQPTQGYGPPPQQPPYGGR